MAIATRSAAIEMGGHTPGWLQAAGSRCPQLSRAAEPLYYNRRLYESVPRAVAAPSSRVRERGSPAGRRAGLVHGVDVAGGTHASPSSSLSKEREHAPRAVDAMGLGRGRRGPAGDADTSDFTAACSSTAVES
jgi:hypothetical protein